MKIEGEKELKTKLTAIGDYIKIPKKSLKEAILMWKDTTEKEVFDSEGSSMSKRWTRLSPSYAKVKRWKYPGKGILEASGKMRKNFKTKVSSTRAILSNPTSYFKYHQLGTRKMPQRQVLHLDSKRVKETEKIFNKDIDKILK